jgi:hypothetical protein
MSFLPPSRFLRVALLLAAAGIVWLLIRFFDSDRGLLLRQEDLVEWARTGSPSDFESDFAATDYRDQWSQTAPDVVLMARAVRLSHPGMILTAGPRRIERDGDNAVITQKVTVTGAGDRIETDFHFTWHKESAWPWSWKLKKVTSPGVP